MKLIITYTLAFFSFIICNAQNNSKKTAPMIPELDNEFEKFDITVFEKEVNSVSGKRILKKENRIQIEEVQSYGFIKEIYYSNNFFLK